VQGSNQRQTRSLYTDKEVNSEKFNKIPNIHSCNIYKYIKQILTKQNGGKYSSTAIAGDLSTQLTTQFQTIQTKNQQRKDK
jgi:hypothetical protein